MYIILHSAFLLAETVVTVLAFAFAYLLFSVMQINTLMSLKHSKHCRNIFALFQLFCLSFVSFFSVVHCAGNLIGDDLNITVYRHDGNSNDDMVLGTSLSGHAAASAAATRLTSSSSSVSTPINMRPSFPPISVKIRAEKNLGLKVLRVFLRFWCIKKIRHKITT